MQVITDTTRLEYSGSLIIDHFLPYALCLMSYLNERHIHNQ